MASETCASLMVGKSMGQERAYLCFKQRCVIFWVVTRLLLCVCVCVGEGVTAAAGWQSGCLEPADSPQQITPFPDEALLLIKTLLHVCHQSKYNSQANLEWRQLCPSDLTQWLPSLLTTPLKLTLLETGLSVWSKLKGMAAFEASFLFLAMLLWNTASGFLCRNFPSFYHNQDLVCFLTWPKPCGRSLTFPRSSQSRRPREDVVTARKK